MVGEAKPEKGLCFCPYCDEEILEAMLPSCKGCGVAICYCPKCQKPVPRDKKLCPHCGAEMKD